MKAFTFSNFSRKAAATLASALFMIASAQGGFTLRPGLGSLTDKDGADISSDSLVIVVVDLSGDGVSHPTSSAFAPGSDDFVLGALGAKPFTGLGTLASGQVTGDIGFSLSDGVVIDPGDSVALFWFPDLTATNFLSSSDLNGNQELDDLDPLLAPGDDISFGAYNTAESLPTGGSLDPTWVIPSDGATTDLSGVAVSLGGTVPDDLLTAAFNTKGAVIPEPSSAILALFGSAFLLLRRRK